MTVTSITSLAQFREITSRDKFAVVDFWAASCGPCRITSPTFEKLSGQFPSIDFYKVDVEGAQDIAQEVGVRVMPTFIAYRNGRKVKDLVGASPQQLETLINNCVDAV